MVEAMNNKKLWETKHPYYCNEGNYFARSDECSSHYKTWQDFFDEQGDSDLDMNLVFRWDWSWPCTYDDDGKPHDVLHHDPNYRDGVLTLFIMGQRKGLFRWVTVEVCQNDEPTVREWLLPRWQRLIDLWSPISGGDGVDE
jgi:hypothetical protein